MYILRNTQVFVSSECQAIWFRKNLLAGRHAGEGRKWVSDFFIVLTIYTRNQIFFFLKMF